MSLRAGHKAQVLDYMLSMQDQVLFVALSGIIKMSYVVLLGLISCWVGDHIKSRY